MKKIYYILAIVCCTLCISSCSSSDEEETTAFSIIKSNVEFSPKASEGTIEINSTLPITATSSKEWCIVNVEGKIIKVKVEQSNLIESRSALVTISDGITTKQINVHQSGALWKFLGKDEYLTNDDATEITINAYSDYDYNIEYSDSWISGEMTDDGFIVKLAENDTNNPRVGTITFKSDIRGEKVYKFYQFGIKDITGKYKASYSSYNDDDELEDYELEDITIDPYNAETNTVSINGLTQGLNVPISFNYDKNDNSLYIQNGTYICDFPLSATTTYYLLAITNAYDSEEDSYYINFSPSYKIKFGLSLNKETMKPIIEIIDTGEWTGEEQVGMNIQAFTNKTASRSSNKGALFIYYYLSLEKVD